MTKSLRTQFMDYMTLNRYSPWTIQHYMDIVRRLAEYFNKSPDLITQEEIQEYLLYLYQERKLEWELVMLIYLVCRVFTKMFSNGKKENLNCRHGPELENSLM